MTSPAELEYRLADLRLSLSARRFSLALDDMVQKYRPDQPRMPKGTPEGGQWVFEGNSTSNRIDRADVQRLALTEFGLLATEWRLKDGTRMCVYDLDTQMWIMVKYSKSHIGCRRMLH